MLKNKADKPRILTKSYVNELNEPGDYGEQELRGFFVRVTAKGTKTYFVENSVRGGRSSVSIKIGRHNLMSTSVARESAKTVLYQMGQGIDPNKHRLEVREQAAAEEIRRQVEASLKNITVGDVLAKYLRDRALKASTASDYEHLSKRCFGDWLALPITAVSKDLVEQRFRALSEHSKSQANKAMRVLRALFNYADAAYEDADGRSLVPENPTKRLKQLRAWHRIARRERVLRDHELEKWYAAVMRLENETVRDYLRLLLFTGLRRSEAAGLRWEHVDFAANLLMVVDTKNHRDHMLPLSSFVRQLLWQRRKDLLATGLYGTFVFPGPGRTGHLKDPRKQLLLVTKETGIEFSSHDLRRTISTIADQLGIDKYTVARLLNHKSAGVTEGYIIAEAERLREPLSAIAEHLCKKIKHNSMTIEVEVVHELANATGS